MISETTLEQPGSVTAPTSTNSERYQEKYRANSILTDV
ncbi:hypothetical protein T01_364 [Trichinella spiralis]|uniref:Uncharacterized protein n=1 Tax=Trichinella spiralis TaxID=6334 RepID=A0A0V0YQ73_TRISP|nr:hypothetical protein T01_364 [Trichinella spiralis]